MNSRAMAAAGAFASVLGLAACGGAAKPADSPGTCPEGTVLKGEDCVTAGAGGDAPPGDESPPTQKKHTEDEDKPSSSAPVSSESKSPGGKSYERESVEVELRRASRQIKANCGSATDEEGSMTGPWGSTRAHVVLGRNGHVKQVTVPAPYDGKAVGVCVVHSFEKIQFPPYAASSDEAIDWDVEIVQPKRK